MFTPVRISKAQWQPAIRSPRPFIGQAQFPATLSIMVAKDAAPAAKSGRPSSASRLRKA